MQAFIHACCVSGPEGPHYTVGENEVARARESTLEREVPRPSAPVKESHVVRTFRSAHIVKNSRVVQALIEACCVSGPEGPHYTVGENEVARARESTLEREVLRPSAPVKESHVVRTFRSAHIVKNSRVVQALIEACGVSGPEGLLYTVGENEVARARESTLEREVLRPSAPVKESHVVRTFRSAHVVKNSRVVQALIEACGVSGPEGPHYTVGENEVARARESTLER